MSYFTPPNSDLGKFPLEFAKKRIFLGKVLSFLGLISLLSLLGLYQSGKLLIEGLDSITLNGVGDPKVMAGHISRALVPMLSWLVFSFPGFIFIYLSIFLSGYRVKAYFYIWCLVAFVLIISIPFGSAFGLILAVTLYIKRKEFLIK